VWWFFLAWMPSYLVKTRGLTTMGSAKLLIIAYVAADVGSVGGGWISSYLIKRGWSVGPARYYAMGLCAICMPGAILAAYAGQTWQAIALISLALAAHQGWSANLFTTATDMFPANVTGSVVGLGGTAGAIGGMLMTLIVGGLLNWKSYYTPMFIWAGFMHPLSLLIYYLFVGSEMRKADVDAPRRGVVPSLLTGASFLTLVGLVGTILIGRHWEYVVTVMKGASAAAAGVTASAGVALIGMLLIYASLKKNPVEAE
jgi:ACS family hexuronate transporter-like MFS transporter